MIQVHLQQIPENGTLHLWGESDPHALGLQEAQAEALGPLRYDLQVGLSGKSLFATGVLTQKIKMNCVLCLEPFEFELQTTQFALQRDLEGAELVDLTEEVREDIHLLLPMHPRCDMGGEKKCSLPFSKKLLSFQKHLEHGPMENSSQREDSIWSALDDLKNIH